MKIETQHSERIFGLDLLRSLAILIVVISHTAFILQDTFPGFPYLPTPDGVDLFFVLSGFLIGKILIKQAETQNDFNLKSILHFLKRRWFKTLPNYYLFLLLNIVLVYFGFLQGTLNKYTSTYFVFFQNFYKPIDFLFWESWSLAVEEWFYLLFPFLLMTFHYIFKSKVKTTFLSTLLLMLLMPLLIRVISLNFNQDYDLYYRKLVITKLDTIGFGILGAYLFYYQNGFWNKYKNSFFILGLLLMIYLFRYNENSSPVFYRTFFVTLNAISIFLMLPFFNSLREEKIPFKPFRFISKISYAMYLVNLPIILILKPLMESHAKGLDIGLYLVIWLLIFILSYLIYRFFEKPIMDLREKK